MSPDGICAAFQKPKKDQYFNRWQTIMTRISLLPALTCDFQSNLEASQAWVPRWTNQSWVKRRLTARLQGASTWWLYSCCWCSVQMITKASHVGFLLLPLAIEQITVPQMWSYTDTPFPPPRFQYWFGASANLKPVLGFPT